MARTHPLDRNRRHIIGIKIGNCRSVSDKVGEHILAVACHHECTIWEAVALILESQEEAPR